MKKRRGLIVRVFLLTLSLSALITAFSSFRATRQLKEKFHHLMCSAAVKSGKVQFWVFGVENEDVCAAYSSALATSRWSGKQGMPRILHQSWKMKEIPGDFKTWSNSWKQVNPKWKYWFWTDADNREFVEKHYPEFLDTYNKLPYEIERADMVRAFYLHMYGGVYADLDTWCLRPMDSLVNKGKLYLAEMSDDTQFGQNIPNAWMASSPGHPFWIFFAKLIQTIHEKKPSEQYIQPEQATGPMILKQALDAWRSLRDDSSIKVIKAGQIFVDDWHQFHGEEETKKFAKFCNKEKIHQEKVNKDCLKHYPEAYVITFWTHTWGKKRMAI